MNVDSNMQVCNIPRHIADDHYRYKRPCADISNQVGRITLVNTQQICKAIDTIPYVLSKYMGTELATQCRIHENQIIVNGRHSQKDIDRIVEKFISEYVLCEKCGLPELDYVVNTAENYRAKCLANCRACGNSEQLSDTDNLYHILTKTIKVSKLPQADTHIFERNLDYLDDGKWSIGVSAEDVRMRHANETMSDRVRELTIPPEEIVDNEPVTASPQTVLQGFLEVMPLATNQQIYHAIKKIKNDFSLSTRECVSLIFEVFLDGEKLIYNIEKAAPLLRVFNSEGSQKNLIGYIELTLGVEQPHLLAHMSAVLLRFYRERVLSLSVLHDWHSKKRSKSVSDKTTVAKIRVAASPFFDSVQ